jgi:hypothetical protein
MWVQRTPCAGGERVEPYWLCLENGAAIAENDSGTIRFPLRRDASSFRQQLEKKYREGLGRAPIATAVDPESATTWLQEYLRLRMSDCTHEETTRRIFDRIQGDGIQPACGTAAPTNVPPRDQTLAFRIQLERHYRDTAAAVHETYVDAEGEVAWIDEYLRARLSGCTHQPAVDRVMRQIDGRKVSPGC